MKYILNSAVITAPGHYNYKIISVEKAKEFLRDGDFQSTIGYTETAEALKLITGIEVPVNRRIIRMEMGDEALVFRLTLPPGSDRLAVASKGHLTPEFVIAHCELGLLQKL